MSTLRSQSNTWRRVRLNNGDTDSIYRWRGVTFPGFPQQVESFISDPGIRAEVGRWLRCPNFNVSMQIKRRFALQAGA